MSEGEEKLLGGVSGGTKEREYGDSLADWPRGGCKYRFREARYRYTMAKASLDCADAICNDPTVPLSYGTPNGGR